MRLALPFALAFAVACFYPLAARSDDDESEKSPTAWPTTYLDLRTTYSAVPSGVLAFGFGNAGGLLSSDLDALASRLDSPHFSPTLPSSQSLIFDAPLTVDVNEQVSIFGGVSGATSQMGSSPWSSLTLNTWNVGITADVIQQQGIGPTVTIQPTLTVPIRSNRLGIAATTLQTDVELSYALNEDQTQGFIVGAQDTIVSVSSGLAILNPTVDPAIIGYAGGYYQWPSDWKLTGRFGLQSFGGAQIGSLIQAKGFTGPIGRIDFDKVDDNDNRLFGAEFEIAWTPKPLFQFVLRTPLYAVRN